MPRGVHSPSAADLRAHLAALAARIPLAACYKALPEAAEMKAIKERMPEGV